MRNLQVYLLAAGRGERSGGPKAWKNHAGKPLLLRQFDFLLTYIPAAQVAVSIQDAWRTRCLALQPRIRWVPVDPAATPLASLQALIRAVPMKSWAFLYHVDMPVWQPELFQQLADQIPSASQEGFEAIAPIQDGRKGHPVLLSPALGPQIASLNPASDRLDHWLRTRKEKTVEVPFPSIHDNWNEPVAE